MSNFCIEQSFIPRLILRLRRRLPFRNEESVTFGCGAVWDPCAAEGVVPLGVVVPNGQLNRIGVFLDALIGRRLFCEDFVSCRKDFFCDDLPPSPNGFFRSEAEGLASGSRGTF